MAPPLQGIKVVEFAGLAPGPFAGLILSDWGASVIRVDRVDQESSTDILSRGKQSIAINFKIPSGFEALLRLISTADVLIDPFRPGVLEKSGLGPDVFFGEKGRNSRLIYARLSGFERQGKYRDMAGHDLNYLAQSGILSMLPPASPDGRPSFPLNILADLAGGGMTCALGILLALLERTKSAKGQVVQADMVSGTRYVSSYALLHGANRGSKVFGGAPGTNILDGGLPYYSLYKCKDGKWMTVACLEPQFCATFLDLLMAALPPGFKGSNTGFVPSLKSRGDLTTWPQVKSYLEAAFLTRTRDEWAATFLNTDACAMPVLTVQEAGAVSVTRSIIPAPHPDLIRTPSLGLPSSLTSLSPGAHTIEVLREIGLTGVELQKLADDGAFGSTSRAKL